LVYERGKIEPALQSVRRIANKPCYYSITLPDGSKSDLVDQYVQMVESRAAPFLRMLEKLIHVSP
jgi:ABC-type molybdate transport system substrate-binding protein